MMKIALINPIAKTVDQPRHWYSLFGRTLDRQLETDADVNFVRMARAISEKGNACHVFVSDVYRPRNPMPGSESLRVVYLRTVLRWLFAPAYFPFVTGLYSALKKGGYDVVQASELTQPATIVAALASRRIFVWQEQDQYSCRPFVRLFQFFYFNTLGRLLARKVVFIPRSNSAKKFLERLEYGDIRNAVPTGLDTKGTFYPVDVPEEYLLVVSRIAADKGFDLLLDVMARVVEEMPSARLLIKGDGPLRPEVERKIEKLNLGKNVRIDPVLEPQGRLNDTYNRALLTIIPTRGGLFPFVALESMAAGKPVVSSFARALKDVVIDGRTGYIVRDEREMAERIVFLAKDDESRKRMGREALALIKDYDFERVAGRFLDVYRSSR